jgi:hypothetical protein
MTLIKMTAVLSLSLVLPSSALLSTHVGGRLARAPALT